MGEIDEGWRPGRRTADIWRTRTWSVRPARPGYLLLAKTDAHFLDHFGHAQRLESVFAAVGTPFRSHKAESRAVCSSYDDVLAVVAFFLDAVVDERVERLAAMVPREPNGDWVITTDQRIFIWQL